MDSVLTEPHFRELLYIMDRVKRINTNSTNGRMTRMFLKEKNIRVIRPFVLFVLITSEVS
jgi:hypothetical protein